MVGKVVIIFNQDVDKELGSRWRDGSIRVWVHHFPSHVCKHGLSNRRAHGGVGGTKASQAK